MSSIKNTPFSINGVVSTDKSALQNLNNLATAAASFITYDVALGKWAVIINKTGTSVASFSDSNIVGSINVSETSVEDLYNSVSIEFPHQDMKDQTDYVDLEIPSADRYDNEVDNRLNITCDVINDPITAQYLATIELNQNRLSKVITFSTDYTGLGLKAGDIIDVTADMYEFSSKLFRIVKLEESDDEGIGVSITALEYSDTIYDDSALVRTERNKETGILLREQNDAIQLSDDIDQGAILRRLLLANVGAGIVNNLLGKLFGRQTDGDGEFTGGMEPGAGDGTGTENEKQLAKELDELLAAGRKPPIESVLFDVESACEGDTVTLTISHTCTSCLFDIPEYEYDYTITGVDAADIDVDLTGTITIANGATSGTLTIVTQATAGGTDYKDLAITVQGIGDTVRVYDIIEDKTYSVTSATNQLLEGNSLSGGDAITITTTGIDDGTDLNFTLSGTGLSQVTSATSGTVTINSNTATYTLTTSDDVVYTGVRYITFTLEPLAGNANPCYSGSNTFTRTIQLNDANNSDGPFVNCEYTTVPVVWCGKFKQDGTLTDITVLASARFAVPQNSEPTVSLPLTCSVSGGAISVDSTVSVASDSSLGGIPYQVITTFSSVGTNGLITGSATSTVYGYPVTSISSSDLTNFSSATPSDNDILRYNSTSGQWEPESL